VTPGQCEKRYNNGISVTFDQLARHGAPWTEEEVAALSLEVPKHRRANGIIDWIAMQDVMQRPAHKLRERWAQGKK
jgi:hypothetical protein